MTLFTDHKTAMWHYSWDGNASDFTAGKNLYCTPNVRELKLFGYTKLDQILLYEITKVKKIQYLILFLFIYFSYLFICLLLYHIIWKNLISPIIGWKMVSKCGRHFGSSVIQRHHASLLMWNLNLNH